MFRAPDFLFDQLSRGGDNPCGGGDAAYLDPDPTSAGLNLNPALLVFNTGYGNHHRGNFHLRADRQFFFSHDDPIHGFGSIGLQ